MSTRTQFPLSSRRTCRCRVPLNYRRSDIIALTMLRVHTKRASYAAIEAADIQYLRIPWTRGVNFQYDDVNGRRWRRRLFRPKIESDGRRVRGQYGRLYLCRLSFTPFVAIWPLPAHIPAVPAGKKRGKSGGRRAGVSRVRCEKRRNRKFPREPTATSLEYAARLYSPPSTNRAGVLILVASAARKCIFTLPKVSRARMKFENRRLFAPVRFFRPFCTEAVETRLNSWSSN